jgi:hypothetical protein
LRATTPREAHSHREHLANFEHLWHTLAGWALRPIDASGLAIFRILWGTLMSVAAARYLIFGWVDTFYTLPTFHFKYWGFAWVPIGPGWLIQAQCAAMVLLGLAVASGSFYRLSAALLAMLYAWQELRDVSTYLNHHYFALLVNVLLVFLPLHRCWSVDAWRKPTLRSATLPAICRNLLMFQVALVYFGAALAKVGSDWLMHAQPLDIWLSARDEVPILGRVFAQPWAPTLMSWGGFLYDATIVLWLLWPKSRPLAYLAVIAFHVTTRTLFEIGMFPWIMIIATTVFFVPDWPRRLVKWWRQRSHSGPPGPGDDLPANGREQARSPAETWRLTRARGIAAFFLVAYCLLQIMLPLRHHLYPGNILWHEQGMRWSWRVMVREKTGSITYRVELNTGKQLEVSPARYLTAHQVLEMAGQPDLILQLAHEIARDYDARGLGPVAVYADAWVSLNGRRAVRLIDPNVDLAATRDGLARAHWILPAPTSLPPTLRRGGV